jgi:ribonuclease P protein component
LASGCDDQQQQEEVAAAVDGYRPLGRFSKRQRVKKRSEFRQIQAAAHRVVTPHFVMLIRRSSSSDNMPRLGITASRKVGNAVLRNRAKRLVREAFRATRSLWAATIDVVVVVRHFDGQKKLDEVVAEWLEARDKIQRRCEAALAATPAALGGVP